MNLILEHRFVPLVRSGFKICTTRAVRKRPIRVGDEVRLVYWQGRAYRSPQQWLATVRISAAPAVEILQNGDIILAGGKLTDRGRYILATNDGFDSPQEYVDYCRASLRDSAISFRGHVYFWDVYGL